MSKRSKKSKHKKGKPKPMSRSKDAQYNLSVIKRINLGHIPLFIQLAHKGLEKSVTEGEKLSTGESVFTVPKDILALSVSKPSILEGVERIEVVYQKG